MNVTPNIQLHGEQNNILLTNEYMSPEDSVAEAYDLAKSKDIGEALNNAYPGHLWAVRVQSKQGIATVHNMALSDQWGYVIKLDNVYSASHLVKRGIDAGGEILERFKVARGRVDDDKMDSLQRDFAGRVLGDKSK